MYAADTATPLAAMEATVEAASRPYFLEALEAEAVASVPSVAAVATLAASAASVAAALVAEVPAAVGKISIRATKIVDPI